MFAKVVDVDLIEEALDRHLDLRGSFIGVDAVDHGDNTELPELEPLDEGVGVPDVTGEPREIIDDDAVEARVG
ncbi:MAG: hypothetical protein ABR961_13470 [Thermoanaerobaculaceae bacterium]